jgi:hypothetical protein
MTSHRVWILQYPDIHAILKFGFGYQTVNDLYPQLYTKIISNIRKMLSTSEGLLIAFEYYEFATQAFPRIMCIFVY